MKHTYKLEDYKLSIEKLLSKTTPTIAAKVAEHLWLDYLSKGIFPDLYYIVSDIKLAEMAEGLCGLHSSQPSLPDLAAEIEVPKDKFATMLHLTRDQKDLIGDFYKRTTGTLDPYDMDMAMTINTDLLPMLGRYAPALGAHNA